MGNFINVLIDECKKKIVQATGEECTNDTAWRKLDQIFKNAQIPKENKSKIFSNYAKSPKYKITRRQAVSLGIAFEFNIAEMNAFLSKAGYFLSDYHLEDTIIIYLISIKEYKISSYDIALADKGMPILSPSVRRSSAENVAAQATS